MEFINMPSLETKWLILRKSTEQDIGALFTTYSDPEVNTYLPQFLLKALKETRALFKTEYRGVYRQSREYCYAIYLKSNQIPIGYVNVGTKAPCDLGYELHRELWHNGIIDETYRTVVRQLKRDGFPYITAAHDMNNPHSGEVIKQLGMSYKYTYEEQWQLKDTLVILRMYQLNFDEQDGRVYEGYWDRWAVHFIERDTYNTKEEKGLK